MNSLSSSLEREALDEFERRINALGYILLRQPDGRDLPQFLAGFRPDAIATGRLPNLIVEVLARRGSNEVEATKVKQLQQLLAGRDDWRLEVVYTTPSAALPRPASAKDIRHRFDQIKALAAVDRPAALIMSWSVLEATCRAAMPERAARALTPGTAVEFLASLGYIVQSEAEILREAGQARNLIVHGDIEQTVSSELLNSVLDVVDALIHHLEGRAPS